MNKNAFSLCMCVCEWLHVLHTLRALWRHNDKWHSLWSQRAPCQAKETHGARLEHCAPVWRRAAPHFNQIGTNPSTKSVICPLNADGREKKGEKKSDIWPWLQWSTVSERRVCFLLLWVCNVRDVFLMRWRCHH